MMMSYLGNFGGEFDLKSLPFYDQTTNRRWKKNSPSCLYPLGGIDGLRAKEVMKSKMRFLNYFCGGFLQKFQSLFRVRALAKTTDFQLFGTNGWRVRG